MSSPMHISIICRRRCIIDTIRRCDVYVSSTSWRVTLVSGAVFVETTKPCNCKDEAVDNW